MHDVNNWFRRTCILNFLIFQNSKYGIGIAEHFSRIWNILSFFQNAFVSVWVLLTFYVSFQCFFFSASFNMKSKFTFSISQMVVTLQLQGSFRNTYNKSVTHRGNVDNELPQLFFLRSWRVSLQTNFTKKTPFSSLMDRNLVCKCQYNLIDHVAVSFAMS